MYIDFVSQLTKPIELVELEDFWHSVNQISELIDDDPSLRGDLAHCFFAFSSVNIKKGETKKHGIPQATIFVELKEFSEILGNGDLARNGRVSFSFPTPELETHKKFLNRAHDGFGDNRIYATYIFFLASFENEFEDFSQHRIFREIGKISRLITNIREYIRSSSPNISGLSRVLRDFTSYRRSIQVQRTDLGGMLEIGDFSRNGLWKLLFGLTDVPRDWRVQDSLEKYFCCYRANGPNLEVARFVKTFLVFQSPGRKREHFAFKNFARIRGQRVRRSSGGILQLGKTIACYGGSQLLFNEDDPAIKPEEMLGPKMFVFDGKCFFPLSGYLTGKVVSMDDDDDCISAPVVCSETSVEHSDQASLGELTLSELENEDKNIASLFGSLASEVGQGAAYWLTSKSRASFTEHPLYSR